METNEAIEADGRHQRRIKNLVINRRFQIKYTTMIVGLSLTISLVLGTFLMEKVRENSRMLELESQFNDALQQQLAASDARLLFSMVLSFVLFNAALSIVAIFLTHRIVGPIFVITRYVREIGEGKVPKLRGLRKGDEFVELYEALQTTVHGVEQRLQGEIELLERSAGQLAASPSADGVKQELLMLAELKRRALARENQESIDLQPS